MHLIFLLLLVSFSSCHTKTKQLPASISSNKITLPANPYTSVAAIPLPPGYTRLPAASNSFAAWLRKLPLKKNKTVYLYNGMQKANQSAQFAVIDISTGDKDLQQCADAVMRLRAEYLYGAKNFDAIDFTDNHQTHYRLPASTDRAGFNKYLEKVFSYCGTASLEKQLLAVKDCKQIEPGDVLIKGGSPGHAMQVMDVAINKDGQKIYLLAQSYMPAQDMHIVVNPAGDDSPWYKVGEGQIIETPEWVFKTGQLKKWPGN